MKKTILSFAILALAIFSQSCVNDHVVPIEEPTSLTSAPFFNGLQKPIGIELDGQGNIWVTEAGTGSNDGSVSMITPSGQKTVFVGGLPSAISQGSIEGISKLLYKNGTLYFLHGVSGRLYIADVSGFKPGDGAKNLVDIESHDIGDFVRDQGFTDPVNSNGFELVFGPDNNLYFVDAGGNAIIKRDQGTGTLSVFAEFPKTAGGKDAVPTGIVFDGTHFVVSTLTGFPFTPGDAKIYKVAMDKTVTASPVKFTTLAGIVLSANNKPIAIQHGTFGMGFTPGTGMVVDENNNMLLGGLSQPTDIVRWGDKMYYLLSYADGTISKLSY